LERGENVELSIEKWLKVRRWQGVRVVGEKRGWWCELRWELIGIESIVQLV
jgi:hypothetical protein